MCFKLPLFLHCLSNVFLNFGKIINVKTRFYITKNIYERLFMVWLK